MISKFLLDIVFGLLNGMFALLPNISWSVETSAFGYFLSIIRVASYMLPMGTITTICGLVTDIMIFRIIVAIVRTIWDVLPLV